MREEEGLRSVAASSESGMREKEGMQRAAASSESGMREEEGMQRPAASSERVLPYLIKHEHWFFEVFTWMGALQLFGALITLIK
ncbi:hypothetical protein AB6A40_010693 [Gnathostoma spinigerum]|uniref:Uncharacterized protein n=1 Tax=Gnathostoma spinigerum TaxID=75299 RepID=A0ABD6EVJ7_9BILA